MEYTDKPTVANNYMYITEMKRDIDWIKKTIMGVFGAVFLNIIINLVVVRL